MDHSNIDRKKELVKINQLISKLKQIAQSDGYISNDEQSIIDSIIPELERYKSRILEIQDKKEVNQDDLDKINQFKQHIVEKVKSIAFDDNRYNEEEWKLVEAIKQFAGT